MTLTTKLLLHTLVEPASCDGTGVSFEHVSILFCWRILTNATSFIALHGLGGHWKGTWTAVNGYCWLSAILAQKFPGSRILSAECPELLKLLASPAVDVTDVIENVVHDRLRENRSDKPVVFVCHSFGGIVAQQIFLSTHPERAKDVRYHGMHDAVQACIYFGTPQKQAPVSSTPALWRALEFDCATTLGGKSSDLQLAIMNSSRINDDFREFGGENLQSICLFETAKTDVGLSEVQRHRSTTA